MAKSEFIPLNDLKRHNLSIRAELSEAMERVLSSGWFILGPEVEAFESEFATYCGTSHCVGLANGTDALELALRALEVGAGDEVATVANAGMYGTTAIRAVGGIPTFVEIDGATMNIDPAALDSVITRRTKAVIATHLYGRMADMPAILRIARRHGIAVIEDCAQSHGALMEGRRAGSWGDIGCFSFYPTKNLGALGDGGALTTSDKGLADRARSLRQYGWSSKYSSDVSGGRNSRLDEMQAAILRVKLGHLDAWNLMRREIAGQYDRGLAGSGLTLPHPPIADEMIYHLYVVRAADREQLRGALKERGIGCDAHYPTPDYLQPSCADLGLARGYLPLTEQAAVEVLSIPCFAELSDVEIESVVMGVQGSSG